MAKRTVVPAETREGEFAKGGTGGFDALESYHRLRTPEDQKNEIHLRASYKLGLESGNWTAFNAAVKNLRERGWEQSGIDRLIRSASFQSKRAA